MLEEYDFTNARKNPYIQREGGAADEQEDEYGRLAREVQPVAGLGAASNREEAGERPDGCRFTSYRQQGPRGGAKPENAATAGR